MMKKVVMAHVYDVTNSESGKANSAILRINRIFKDGIGVGGIFHSAIQVYGELEWSFGYCQHGSGVFNCKPCKNPLFTYRESFILGETSYSPFTVNEILRELSVLWPGNSYDLLSRNCNHFCNVFCEMIEVPKLPAWVNRFANAGDAAMEVAEATQEKLHQAKSEIVSVSKGAVKIFSNARSKAQGTTKHHPSPSNKAIVVAGRKRMSNPFNKLGGKPSSAATVTSSKEVKDDKSSSEDEAHTSRIKDKPRKKQH